MTPEQTSALVAALVTLFGAITAWLTARSVQHGAQLNGSMDERIAAGAKAAVANDHALRGETPSPATNPATQARVAAMVAELQRLDPTVLAVPPVVATAAKR